MRQILAGAAVVLFVVNLAPGAVYTIAQRAVVGSNLTSSAPGTPFSLDYTAFLTNVAQPYDVKQVGFIFDGFSTSFAQLQVQLDASPTVFSFDSSELNHRQLAYTLYDPAITTPGSGPPATPVYVVLPQAWRDEMTDGVLSGRLWVTSPSNAPSNYLFSAQTMFEVVPEPSAGMALGAVGALALRRRRR